eukprot:jgi/Hompol1/4961/HPOL_004059-RA
MSSGSGNKRRRPLTIPVDVVKEEDGNEYLVFCYTNGGQSTEYRIRIDGAEAIDIDQLSPSFKHINSVYPRANVPESEYTGNRYQYESSVNVIGWRLAFMNEELVGKRVFCGLWADPLFAVI